MFNKNKYLKLFKEGLHFSLLTPCASGCGGAADLPVSYRTCEVPGDVLEYGTSTLILEKCTHEFVNILDVAEWQAAIASGDIAVLPAGIIKPGEPSGSSFVVDGEGTKKVGTVTMPISYDCSYFAADASDTLYWQTIWANIEQYRIMWCDKNGRLALISEYATAVAAGSPATVAGYAAGFPASFTKIPAEIEGENGTAKWNTEFEIRAREVIQKVIIPGLYPVIKAI